MSAWLDAGLGVGAGYAAVLVQLHLGIGLALLVLASAVGSLPSPDGRGRRPWEAGLRAAAAAAGPAPALAAFALIQASSASPDLLTWAGLLASTSAVVLGALHAAMCSCYELEPPVVNARSGAITVSAPPGDNCEGGRAVWYLSALARALSSLRACGGALLLLASPPAGVQLLCASALLRLALGVHALRGAASALALPSSGTLVGLLREAEVAAGAAPLVGSLALLDYAALGPGSALLAPLHPVLYCALLVLTLIGLSLAVRASLGGSMEAAGGSEFDFRFTIGEGESGGDIGAHVERLRRLLVACLHAAMAASMARIVAGAFSIDASTTGFSIEWGELLFATASLLTALLVASHAAEFALARASEAASQASAASMNGCGGSGHGGAEAAPEAPGITSHAKAIVAPVQSLVLALLVAHAQALGSASLDAAGSAASLAALPFRYGLVLAAAGVGMQVSALLALALVGGGAAATLDGTGTPRWEPEGSSAGAAAGLRWATLLCLEGGLCLGWAGLGVQLWAALGLVLGPCAYALLPAEARATFREVAGAFGGSVKEAADGLASCAQAYAKQRQYEQEALHARKADAMAAEVEKELGAAGEARGGKAPKGLRAKAAAPPPAEAKAGRAKSAAKPRRR